MGDFHSYYSRAKRAPLLTIFTYGNHEAWNVLAEYNNGGFVAENIFYLGRAGVTNVNDVAIGGLGGLFSPDYTPRRLPQDPCAGWKYYRKEELNTLANQKLDILLLHEWAKPLGQMNIITQSHIPFDMFQGNQNPAAALIWKIRPKFVFMGHMHGATLHAKMGATEVYGLPICAPDSNNFMHVIEL